MRYTRFLLILGVFSLGLNINYSLSSSATKKNDTKKSKQSGDQANHYKKWLNEDVAFIISDEEKSTFKALSNDEERDNFVDQFWARRNPDPAPETMPSRKSITGASPTLISITHRE